MPTLRSRRDQSRRRFQILAITLAAVTVIAVGVGVAWDRQRTQTSLSDASTYTPQTSELAAPVAATPIDMSRVGSVLFIGDSWTYGIGAEPETRGFAYRTGEKLGLPFEVHGFQTVGYVNPGVDGLGNYQTRWAAVQVERTPDLIVVQGSSNDSDGKYFQDVNRAAQEFFTVLRAQFPDAQIAVLGPNYPKYSSKNRIDQVDGGVRNAAFAAALPYYSPVRQRWYTAANIDQYMNPMNGSPHPSNEGAEYISDRLIANLRGQDYDPSPAG